MDAGGTLWLTFCANCLLKWPSALSNCQGAASSGNLATKMVQHSLTQPQHSPNIAPTRKLRPLKSVIRIALWAFLVFLHQVAFDAFLLCILKPTWLHFGAHLAQLGPTCSQDAPKTPQLGAKMASRTPNFERRWPQEPPTWSQTAIFLKSNIFP